MGQPLDIAVEVKLDAPEDAIPQCFETDVFHADKLVDRNRVRVAVQALGSSPQDIVVRVRSSTAVDEPIMAVVLRSICGQKGSRRYDFLTEFPTDAISERVSLTPDVLSVESAPPASGAALNPAAIALPARPASPLPATAPSKPVRAPIAATPARPPLARSVVKRPATTRPAPAVKNAPVQTRAAPARASAPVAGKSRLRLEAPPEQSATLQGSAQLSAPTENLPQRAEAAAAWRALNAVPEDVLRDEQRLQALETRDKGARDARAKSESELRGRLERAERRLDEAESNRFDTAIVYGLLALLLAAIAAAAYFWSRARKSAAEAAHWALGPNAPYVNSSGPNPATRPAAKASMTEELQDEGVNESLFKGLKKTPTSGGAALSAAQPAAAGAVAKLAEAATGAGERSADAAHLRTINPEEFFDVQQHAEFFVSLGQYDQAIEVLKKHIGESGEMSPLAFLELFRIYHTLSRQSDYNVLREDFQRIFNCRIANFAAFSDEGLGLDDYPAALLSIETAWGEPRVLDTIEANLFRKPGDTGKPFDLAAYRDLLLLYAIAKLLLRKGEGELPAAERSGRAARLGEDDSVFHPQRLTRPDFSAVHSQTYPVRSATPGPVARAVEDEPELDSGPVPLASTPSYDQELVLDLDLSNSELQALNTGPSLPAPLSTPGPLSRVDIDLPLLDIDDAPDEAAHAPAGAQEAEVRKAPADSGLIDFDLFDPNTEARIAPKSTR